MSHRIVEPRTYPTLEMILNAIAKWMKKYRYAAGLHQELAESGADEVARIARDLGIDTAELFKLVDNGPGAADLLQRMLRALGVDRNTLILTRLSCAIFSDCASVAAIKSVASVILRQELPLKIIENTAQMPCHLTRCSKSVSVMRAPN